MSFCLPTSMVCKKNVCGINDSGGVGDSGDLDGVSGAH